MADNSSIPVASGNETFANKDIGGVKYPRHIQVDGTGAEVAPATEATADAILTKLSDDPATQTTSAAILAKLSADPATGAKQDTGNTSLATIATNTTDAATETTLAALNAKIPATPATTGGQATANASLASIDGTLGDKTDDKSTATDTTSVSAISIWKQISASVQAVAAAVAGTLTVATHAVTQGGSWVLSAGSALIGKVGLSDGTNDVKIRAGSSAPTVADNALVVSMRPDSLDDIFGEYQYVAASQTDQTLGATGASGDYLAGVLIVPSAAAAGAVSIKDGTGSAITIFAGGGTVELPTLAPIFVPLGIYSTDGPWKITTGASVSAIGIGDFT